MPRGAIKLGTERGRGQRSGGGGDAVCAGQWVCGWRVGGAVGGIKGDGGGMGGAVSNGRRNR